MELHYTRPFPWGSAIWGCVATAFVVAGTIDDNQHLAIFALAPAMLALGLLFGRPRDFHGKLTETGLEVDKPKPLNISYSEIENLTISGRSIDPDLASNKRGALMITYNGGYLEIPAGLNIPTHKVYTAIFSLLPLNGIHQISSQFADHVRTETEMFGQDRVHTFSIRSILGWRCSTSRSRTVMVSLIFCGILWIVAYAVAYNMGMKAGYEGWIGAGVLLIIIGSLFWFLLRLRQTSYTGPNRLHKDAELVISPTGIAVKQGDIKGHLQWEELLNIRITGSTPSFQVIRNSFAGNIELIVAGTKIQIFDVYDRPTALIHKLIRRYWKGE